MTGSLRMNLSFVASLFLGFCLLQPALGQTQTLVPPREGDTVEWYEVKPGDNLFTITEKMLGEATLWPENHRLNPQIKDPHILKIGSRIRVITHRKLPTATAEVEKVIRKVMHRGPEDPWENAREGDLLQEKNEVQTFERSATRLRFEDGAHLDIREESLVFLRKVGQTLRGLERQSIEIVEGEADIAQTVARKTNSDIEIVVGNMRAHPKANANGLLATRTRKAPDGKANVMVYDGETSVAAAGSSVSVPKGMGTVVPEGSPPEPPQKLLPAPDLIDPAIGMPMAYANPIFRWQAVPGAASYKLEICSDADCGSPTFRQTEISTNQFRAPALTQGTQYWRVTAVAPNLLDGFPAKARTLTIQNMRPDLLPPALMIVPVGPSRYVDDTTLMLGLGATLKLETFDDASGVAEVSFRWDEGPWQPYSSGSPIVLPVASGAVFKARAVDNLENQTETQAILIRKEVSLPQPPELKKDP